MINLAEFSVVIFMISQMHAGWWEQ